MWRATTVCRGADGISASARPPRASCCSQQSIETRKNVIFRKGIDRFSHISICVNSRCGLLPHLSSLFLQRKGKLRTSQGRGSLAGGSLVEVEGLQRPRVKNQKTGCCLLTPRVKQPTSIDRRVCKPFRGQVGCLDTHPGHRHVPTWPSPPQGTSSISLSPSSPSFSFCSSSSLSDLPSCLPLFSAFFLCPCLSLSLSLPFSLSLSFFSLSPSRFSLSPLFWFCLLSLPLSLLRTTQWKWTP